ncbi:MAG: glycoside hydrolase family 9 protein [Bacteroidota bacterium]
MPKKLKLPFVIVVFLAAHAHGQTPNAWIRINLAGYKPHGIKVAVWCSRENSVLDKFQLVESQSKKIAFEHSAGKAHGAYGPFKQTYRLDFTAFNKPGSYFLRCGEITSPVFNIGSHVYAGAADFSMKYMRQQRSGYNPYLKDSCHTHDGYTMNGPMPDSTHIDVSGGWHDATDYLQYSMTTANATYHLLAAYRDFPNVFGDTHQASGLPGANNTPDVLDEAKWGLDWLIKMHPRPDWLFNQLADDRDHAGFRLPTHDKVDYGKDKERPVYFVTGEPQGLGRFKNRTTGTASTAGKFSSAFALGYQLLKSKNISYAETLKQKARSSYQFALKKPGHTQTACYREPYFYEEENWVDDMELAAAELYRITSDEKFIDSSFNYAKQEKQTPWLGQDTANHYQWYPFINVGHYELAKAANGDIRNQVIAFYREGIEAVAKRASNAFLRGVPFIWCSNNLQTSFAIQCYWYRTLTGDNTFAPLEQAAFDWLLGCNPWGTSMIVGYPANTDFPDDPHSSLNFLHGYQTLGGLVDGPVNGNIYRKQLGVKIMRGDEYEAFQSNIAVYHDDYGDYATNEPTMDGTASLIYLLAAKENEKSAAFTYRYGGIIRGSTEEKNVALVFTGDQFADGGQTIIKTLKDQKIKASFFLTGNFYRNPSFGSLVRELKKEGHYLSAHSDKHLLYCDWNNRDSLLITRQQFKNDLLANYKVMAEFGIEKRNAPFWLPPFEWYNDSISVWANEVGVQLINYSPGTISHADYTTPDMKNYRSSDEIIRSILQYETVDRYGLNGFILLMHMGTDRKRTDKLYDRLNEIIGELKKRGYKFSRVNELLMER